MKQKKLKKSVTLILVVFLAAGPFTYNLTATANTMQGAAPLAGSAALSPPEDNLTHTESTAPSSQPEEDNEEPPGTSQPVSSEPTDDAGYSSVSGSAAEEQNETETQPASSTPENSGSANIQQAETETHGPDEIALMAVPVMDGATLGTDYEYVYLDAERTQIDESAITVLTGQGFAVALAGADVLTRIYMGRDITYGTSFYTHANKNNGTLYGYRPENPTTRYTLYWNGLDVNCPHWDNVAFFTLRDMTIYCVSQYTMLWGNVNTDLAIRNVVYYGPQLAYMGRNYTIENLTMYHQQTTIGSVTGIVVEELMQTCTTATIEGNVTVYSGGNVGNGLFILRPGAQITVSPGATFQLNAGARVFSTGTSPALTIGAGGTFNASVYYFYTAFTDVNVGQNATLDFQVNLGSEQILWATNSLNINGASLIRLRHGNGLTGAGNGLYYTGASNGTVVADTIEIDSALACILANNVSSTVAINAGTLTLNSRGGYGVYFTGGSLGITANNVAITSFYEGIYITRPTTLTVNGTGTIRPAANNINGVTCYGTTLTTQGNGSLTIDTTAHTGGNGLGIYGAGTVNMSGPGSLAILAAGQGVYMDGATGNNITFSGHQRLEITAGSYCLLAAGVNAAFSFNTPQLAILSAGTGSVFRAYDTSTSLTFTTAALNRWGSNISRELIPTTLPDGMWNLPAGRMRIRGNGTGTNSNYNIADTSGLPKAATSPVDSDLTTETLNMANTPLLVFGELTVTLAPLYSESPAINGSTAPAAALSASAMVDAAAQSFAATAEADGSFSISVLPYILDVGSRARVTALSGLLRASGEATVQSSSAFGLTFTELPRNFDFGNQTASAPVARWIMPPTSLVIRVEDNRLRRGPWQITATVNGPLLAQVGSTVYEIDNALAKRGTDGTAEPLGTTPVVLYQNDGSEAGETVVDLSDTLGLYLQAGEGVANATYLTDILWEVSGPP